jgi:Ca2+-binding RTX toxin-like protein
MATPNFNGTEQVFELLPTYLTRATPTPGSLATPGWNSRFQSLLDAINSSEYMRSKMLQFQTSGGRINFLDSEDLANPPDADLKYDPNIHQILLSDQYFTDAYANTAANLSNKTVLDGFSMRAILIEQLRVISHEVQHGLQTRAFNDLTLTAYRLLAPGSSGAEVSSYLNSRLEFSLEDEAKAYIANWNAVAALKANGGLTLQELNNAFASQFGVLAKFTDISQNIPEQSKTWKLDETDPRVIAAAKDYTAAANPSGQVNAGRDGYTYVANSMGFYLADLQAKGIVTPEKLLSLPRLDAVDLAKSQFRGSIRLEGVDGAVANIRVGQIVSGNVVGNTSDYTVAWEKGGVKFEQRHYLENDPQRQLNVVKDEFVISRAGVTLVVPDAKVLNLKSDELIALQKGDSQVLERVASSDVGVYVGTVSEGNYTYTKSDANGTSNVQVTLPISRGVVLAPLPTPGAAASNIATAAEAYGAVAEATGRSLTDYLKSLPDGVSAQMDGANGKLIDRDGNPIADVAVTPAGIEVREATGRRVLVGGDGSVQVSQPETEFQAVYSYSPNGRLTRVYGTVSEGGTFSVEFSTNGTIVQEARLDEYTTVRFVLGQNGEVTRAESSRNEFGGVTTNEYKGADLIGTTIVRPIDGGSAVEFIRPDGSGERYTVNSAGAIVGEKKDIPSYGQTLLSAINDTTSLIEAIKSGKPLPIVVSGLKLVNTLDRNNAIPGLNTATSVGTAVLSIYSLSQALKSGDGLAVLNSATQTIAAVGNAVAAVSGTSNAVSQFFAQGGSGAQVLPALGVIMAIKNGDAVGVLANIAAYYIPVVGWIYAAFQLSKALKGTPEAWGRADFKFDPVTGRLAVGVAGEGIGTGKVQGLMEGNGKAPSDPDYYPGVKGYLENMINQAQAANPQEPLGIIAQRMPALIWREARQSDPGYAVIDFDPLTGQAKLPNLRYDDDMKPFNATGTSQEERYSLLERLVTSAIAQEAIAPMWEVVTAQMQQLAGDPLAGLTEVMRAARRNALAPLDSSGKPINGGKFRPVALDLNGDGRVTVTALAGSTRLFNWDDGGFDKPVGWVGSGEGMLFLDRNPNGQVDGGSELFSNSRVIDAAKGLRALEAVDANGDHVINSLDPVFEELRIWQDLNGDGRSTSNELKKLAELGITELNYSNSRFTRNGQLYSMESPDLEASNIGQRTSVTPEGIKVELSDGTVKVYASRVDDKSLYPGVASIDAAEAVEGSPLDFAVRLSAPSAGITTVQVALQSGSASAGDDYSQQTQVSFDGGRTFENVVNGVVRVPAHLPLFTLRVATVADTYSEGSETLALQATTPANLAPAVGIGTIRNVTVARPTVSIEAPVSVNETDGYAEVTFKLSSAAPNAVTVNWQTVDAGATAGYDYTGMSNGQVVFAAGETSKTYRIPLINDTAVEPTEDFKVEITSVIGADTGVVQKTISIISEDQPPAVLKVDSIYPSANVDEGDPVTFNVGLNIPVGAAGGAAVPLNLSMGTLGGSLSAVSAPVKVSYNNGGTWVAASADAYGDLNLVVPQGVRNFLVVVQTDYDTTRLDRTLKLATPDQSMAGAATVRDRGTSNVYFSEDVASTAEATGATLTYKLKLDYARNTPVTVNVAAALGGTAKEGDDFDILTKSVTFAAGETTKDVQVKIKTDALAEGDESFKLTLLNPVGATLSAASTTAGTLIADASGPLRVSGVDAYSAPEGGYVEFKVNLSATLAANTSVDLELKGNTATAGQDFVNEILVSFDGGVSYTSAGASATATVTVPKDDNGFRVRVVAKTDLVSDPDETFSLSAKLGGAPAADWRTGTATIADVAPPKISITADAASIAENGGKIGYTVKLDQAVGGTVTVDYSATGISATANTDFRLLAQGNGSTTLTFAPGETSKRIEVQVLDDSTYEGNETFSVQLSGVTGPAVLGNGSVTTRIDENDAAGPPAFSVVDDSLPAASEDVPVTYSTADLLRNDSLGGVPGNDAASGLTITGFTPGTGVESIQRSGDTFEVRFTKDFNGTAQFTYSVQTNDGRSTTGKATMQVTPVDDPKSFTPVFDSRPVYGYAALGRIVRHGTPQDGNLEYVLDLTPGEGVPQYTPYTTVGGPTVYDGGEGGMYVGNDFHDYGITPEQFQYELSRQFAGMEGTPPYMKIWMNGQEVWISTSVSPVNHSGIIGYEQSNDGHVNVADPDDPGHQDSYRFISLASTNETYGGSVQSFNGNSFVFTGRRFVWADPVTGGTLNNNYVTDDHIRSDGTREVLLQGKMQNSQGKIIDVEFKVFAFGEAPHPPIQGGGKPIAIDLDGDGFHFKDVDDSNVFFDVNGDGWKRRIAWNNPQDGFIAFDKNADGKITDQDELSFILHKPDGQSDLEALKAFDTNGDGVFSAADKDWNKFGVWRDANSNGITDAGELLTMASLGISSLELNSDGKLRVIDGQSVTGVSRAIKTDGSSYAIADVTLRYRDETLVTPTNGGAPYVAAVPKYQPTQTFEGTAGKDLILGGSGSDIFHAGDGDDVIHDDSGNDYVQAGAGDDVIFTGMDNDMVEAGTGNDQVYAGVGDDMVFGEEGDDLLFLEGGNDIAFGGAGQDTMSGGNGNDTLSGDDGDDKLFGEDGWDALLGQDGNDELRGMDGNDYLDGGAGSDLLLGGAGDDKMDGGAGDDTYEVDSVGDQVIEAANAGNDTVLASISYVLSQAPNVENITLTGTADLSATGDGGDNRLTGNGGKNLLVGGAGNDVLDGGAGADTMQGGQGNDTYYVDNALDVVTELAGEGTDLVVSRVDYVAAENVENVTLTGIATAAATGNALDNVLTGNAQDNVLDGRAGVDTLAGGQGNDRYIVDNTGDVVTEAAGEGYDTVASSLQTTTLAANVEALELTDSAVKGVGNALDNYIVGNAGDNVLQGLAGNDALSGGQGNDVLDGGAGDDLLSGGEGNDQLDGGDGNDRLFGGVGADTMRGGAGDDQYQVDSANDVVVEAVSAGSDTVTVTGVDTYALTDNVETLILGAGARKGSGNAMANTIQGSSEANEIYGLGGDDTITDAGGSDVIDGGDGNDVITDKGTGTNTLHGGAGQDAITVDASSTNTVFGDAGDDTITVGVTTASQAGLGVNVIDGGAGNDVIRTAAGTDTVRFGFGDGSDTWTDDATAGLVDSVAGSDTLSFKEGVRLENLVVEKVGNDLKIRLVTGTNTGNDQLLIKDWYAASTNRIETIRFADGTTVSPELLDRLRNAIRGTDGADTLTGTPQADVIFGLGGNDTIIGLQGDDLLFGGDGDDTFCLLQGDVNGVDQYDGGSGVNTILGSSDYDVLNVTSGLANLKNIQVLDGGIDHNVLNNTILATSGDDVLDFSAMTVKNFTINAGAGNDTVTGTNAADLIVGGAGNDVLSGGAGDDTFRLLQGDVNGVDQYDGGSGTNTVLGSSDYDVLNVTSGLANLKNIQVLDGGIDNNAYNNTILATASEDVLDLSAMTVKNFTINAGAGNDTVTGTNAADLIVGGAGNDVLNGGAGDDTFRLLQGDVNGVDQYDGGSGTNTVLGSSDYDVLNVTSGLANLKNIQVLDGGIDNNVNINTIQATAGNDVLNFSAMTVKNFIIKAGMGNDAVVGTSGVDYIFGDAGDDQIMGSAGNDVLNGGDGNDTFLLQDGVDSGLDQYDGGSGVNTILGSGNDDTLNVTSGLANLKSIQILDGGWDNDPMRNRILATSGNDVLDFSSMTVKNFHINAGAGDDMVTGTSGNDYIVATAGNDVLNGGDGNDTFLLQDGVDSGLDQYDGGSGVNTILGSGNDDTLNVTSGLANLKSIQILDGGWDNDPMRNRILATSGNDVLDFSSMTVKNFHINAGAGDDTVTGTTAGDRILGLEGDDRLIGGKGADDLQGGGGNDTYVYSLGDGTDTISDLLGANQLEFSSGIVLGDLSLIVTDASINFSLTINGVLTKAVTAARGAGGLLGVSSVKVGGQVYDVSAANGGTLTPRATSSSSVVTEPELAKAAYVRPADAQVAEPTVLDRWMAMEGRLAAMPEGFGTSTPELSQADTAHAALIVPGATSTRVRVDRTVTGIA